MKKGGQTHPPRGRALRRQPAHCSPGVCYSGNQRGEQCRSHGTTTEAPDRRKATPVRRKESQAKVNETGGNERPVNSAGRQESVQCAED